jgi:predicted type IV restriction endonuclease
MANIPKKVEERLTAGLKKFQPIVDSAKSRDVNESDTVVIITDLLHEVFGWDKYSELTSEFPIRGTHCDLAIKFKDKEKLRLIIEVKAIGVELKDQHTKQAIDYAANEAVDWVLLTNGINWRLYRVLFTKPIGQDPVCDFDFLSLTSKRADDLALLFILTKESWEKSALSEYYAHQKALSRFSIAGVILSVPVLALIRRELRRLSPDVKIECEQIEEVIRTQIIKREILEGEKLTDAEHAINRSAGRPLRETSTPWEASASASSSPTAPIGTTPTTSPN